jgi:hypothetical protein
MSRNIPHLGRQFGVEGLAGSLALDPANASAPLSRGLLLPLFRRSPEGETLCHISADS